MYLFLIDQYYFIRYICSIPRCKVLDSKGIGLRKRPDWANVIAELALAADAVFPPLTPSIPRAIAYL